MAKKHAGKVIQMLSPENYIRTKARTLPINECRVTARWREEGIASIFITRKHTNGNLTLCVYLVDLFCLGVKDSFYRFNISQREYEEVIGNPGFIDPITISYALAHNIIYAGLEYAEDFGFKPHKNFTSVTRFMLEEDTDDVEFIEIECGKDGKPFYFRGVDDNPQKINSIIKQLEKTAGKGNFDYLISDPDPFNENKYDHNAEEEDDLRLDEFKKWTFEEKKELFLNYESRKEKLNEGEGLRFLDVGNSLFRGLVKDELYNKYYNEFWDDLDFEVSDEEIPDETLGVLPGSESITEESRCLFQKIYNEIRRDTGNAKKLLGKFKIEYPNIPAIYFLELLILRIEDFSEYIRKLAIYGLKFPDYKLISLLVLEDLISNDLAKEDQDDQIYCCQTIFYGRTLLHTIELVHFMRFNLLKLSIKGNATKLDAFVNICEEYEIPDAEITFLDPLIQFAKMRLVYNHLTR